MLSKIAAWLLINVLSFLNEVLHAKLKTSNLQVPINISSEQGLVLRRLACSHFFCVDCFLRNLLAFSGPSSIIVRTDDWWAQNSHSMLFSTNLSNNTELKNSASFIKDKTFLWCDKPPYQSYSLRVRLLRA